MSCGKLTSSHAGLPGVVCPHKRLTLKEKGLVISKQGRGGGRVSESESAAGLCLKAGAHRVFDNYSLN